MRKIGCGSYGDVFLDKDANEAIKKCSHEDGRNIWAGNLREMDILRRCGDHPNIVSLRRVSFDKDKESDHNKLALHLQYYPMNLDDFILTFKEKRLDLSTIRVIMVQILMGLEYLHINKIIHRDMKPNNILINPDTLEVALCDFGMADIRMRYRKAETEVTSPMFRAPEIFEEKRYSYEVDMWAVGLIFHYMLQGDYPYAYPNKEDREATARIKILKRTLNLLDAEDIEKRKEIHEEITNLRNKIKELVLSRIKKINVKETFKVRHTFRNLLIGLLQEDPNKRWTASQSLSSSFFDTVREKYIDSVHEKFKPVPIKLRKISFEDIPERKWISKYTMKYVSDNSEIDSDNLYPVVFHGIDIFEKYLASIRSDDDSCSKKSLGKYLSEQETYLFLYTCFYMAHKYYAITEIPLDFEDFFPEELITDISMEKAEEFEEYLLSKILDHWFFELTLYEIVEDLVNNPEPSDYYKTLKEYLIISQRTKNYNSYRTLYNEHFFKKSVIN